MEMAADRLSRVSSGPNGKNYHYWRKVTMERGKEGIRRDNVPKGMDASAQILTHMAQWRGARPPSKHADVATY